jgi:hypothetical protein
MAQVKINDKKTNNLIEYYMDDRLKNNLDNKVIPSLQKRDKDCFIVIDGKEGTGKSTVALQIGKYVDPTLDLSRIVFDADAFRDAIFKAKKGQVVVFDEAFSGLSSRSALSSVNKVLVSLMMQMRQKNLMILLVLPTFFMLDKYAALFRAKALIHVYENKGVRGYFKLYNSKLKKDLYLAGKKDYSYNNRLIRTRFKGRFYGKFALGSDLLEKEYRKKKAKALEDTEKDPMTSAQIRYKEQRDLLIYLLRKHTGFKYQEMETLLFDYNFNMSLSQISRVCAKFGDTLIKSKDDDTHNGEGHGETQEDGYTSEEETENIYER